jgi:hypothetical protein
MLRMTRGAVACKGVDGGETGAPCRCAGVSAGLEVVEELEDGINPRSQNVESDDRALVMLGDKAQKEYEPIAVAAHGVRTHAADSGGGASAVHGAPKARAVGGEPLELPTDPRQGTPPRGTGPVARTRRRGSR